MPVATTTPPPATPRIRKAVRRAANAVAPCWPLKDFVAVNPFLGVIDRSFGDAAETLARAAGARLFMPRSFYAEAISSGRISTEDLANALAMEPEAARAVGDLHALRVAILRDNAAGAPPAPLPTVSAAAADCTGAPWVEYVTEHVSRWAGRYFDEGQALLPSPFRNLAPYAAWRAEAIHDRTPALLGLPGFRGAAAFLPETPEDLIHQAVHVLGIPEDGMERYFHRLLMTHGGWSAYVRYLDWQRELRGEKPEVLAELLAIRLAWELILYTGLAGQGIQETWRDLRPGLSVSGDEGKNAFAFEVILQRAYELGWQKQIVAGFKPQSAARAADRPAIQAAFCIDVRSEVYRRALEATGRDVETIGFAGFFGLPMAYKPLAQPEARPQCPALLAPRFTVCETLANAAPGEEADTRRQHRAWRRAQLAWKSFKLGAVASFGFVETLGISFAVKLVTDSLGLTRTTPRPEGAGLPAALRKRLTPCLAPANQGGQPYGLEPDTRVELAAGILKAMGLREDIARIVMLAGHGSTSVNNPHAAGLDCGACGGHSGEANVRVLVSLLNDPEVRAGLKTQGVELPADTVFVGAVHDTTTDTITLFDTGLVPESHADDLQTLRSRLEAASRKVRRERAPRLGLDAHPALEQALTRRGRDWSQVRPEWGLAGCASFIAAPRRRTRNLDLGGRAFLHSYDWSQDENFGILELIMTAPLVVASWINLQYYGSAVDNRVFGSGNKTLHNVTGALGVFEGNGGDLRVGLPWQSIHDGERLMHEPLRLTSIIEAPVEAMGSVIEKHENLRNLLDHGWICLYAMDEQGVVRHRYAGDGRWDEVKASEGLRVVAA
ncbi:MAG: DUF2309 domain-containing protein [Candidatus Hydrogenedentes bacterium]|nr:DUF2309 domain-containing protein [Candidatus Hydrogenedentota bacterium]